MHRVYLISFVFVAATMLASSASFALPIDWHGKLGVDTTLVDTFRKVDRSDESANVITAEPGSQEMPLADGDHKNASWQSYLFKLEPVVVVNDSASIKSEFTTGYGSGGRLGDDSTQRKQAGTWGGALYPYNTSGASSDLTVTKLYMELFADTATYVIGRHTTNWGLGVLVNSGEGLWDRFSSTRDGLTIKFKIGNFNIEPYWGKVSANESMTRATNAKEYGVTLLYDNPERDMVIGLLYGKKKNEWANTAIAGDLDGDSVATPLGQTDVKLTDIYFKKIFGRFSLAVEIPIISGELGYVYNNTTQSKYKAKSFIMESKYDASPKWTFGLYAGHVSGDDGNEGQFQASYLHPNYQIANLMFRYNFMAVSDPANYSLYDSYITNAKFVKFFSEYKTDKTSWLMSIIWAKANEVAKLGQQAFNHTNNRIFTSAAEQSDDLGYEIDFGFNFKWNDEVTVGGDLGYHFTGEYYAFTNSTTTTNATEDSFMAQLRVAVDF